MKKFSFALTVETDKETGKTLAVYFQVRKGRAADVRELAGGKAFANYNSQGRLLGVELLAPCKITVLDSVSRNEPKEIKEFIRGKIPREMALV